MLLKVTRWFKIDDCPIIRRLRCTQSGLVYLYFLVLNFCSRAEGRSEGRSRELDHAVRASVQGGVQAQDGQDHSADKRPEQEAQPTDQGPRRPASRNARPEAHP